MPADRRRINQTITTQLNEKLKLNLTDGFCGFKAYRVSAVQKLELSETGYALPLELWVQAAYHQLRIREIPVNLIYHDQDRHFGGSLDEPETRLQHYLSAFERALGQVGWP